MLKESQTKGREGRVIKTCRRKNIDAGNYIFLSFCHPITREIVLPVLRSLLRWFVLIDMTVEIKKIAATYYYQKFVRILFFNLKNHMVGKLC